MSAEIIILACIILLLSYVFDLSSKWLRIPSIIFLLTLGWGLQQLVKISGIFFPDISPLLPIFGTVGLILIVLEGSLDLQLTKSSIPIIRKAFWLSLIPLIVFTSIATYGLMTYYGYTFKSAIINVIPFSVISSAVAIPASQNIARKARAFIVYESSLSDIIGVLLFNFFALNEVYSGNVVGYFFLEIFFILIGSILATVLLSVLIDRLNHHVKFGPILIFIILIYAITKYLHLPGLIFILIFGVVLANLSNFSLDKYLPFIRKESISKEIGTFKEIVAEATFLVRSVFFILFGFLIQTAEILAIETLYTALIITGLIFLLRFFFLLLFRIPVLPYLFIAPRGLITILLFLSIPLNQVVPLVNRSLVIQTVLLSVLVMLFGLLFTRTKHKE